MRTLGLLGGMSWESTETYYRALNEAVRERLGGLHSARLILWSVDFAAVEALMQAGDWPAIGTALGTAARTLESAGAQAIVLCTNTLHCVAPAISASISVPLLHVIDVTAAAIHAAGLTRVGLLGTRFTMEQAFYRQRLLDVHHIESLIPPVDERLELHRIIFEELCLGRLLPASRATLHTIVARLVAQGAQGIILGCTEFGLLLRAEEIEVPVFDTTRLHARFATDWALDATLEP